MANHCPHLLPDAPHTHACVHLIGSSGQEMTCVFAHATHTLLCAACAAKDTPSDVYRICASCQKHIFHAHEWDTNQGSPQPYLSLHAQQARLATLAALPSLSASARTTVALTARQQQAIPAQVLTLEQDFSIHARGASDTLLLPAMDMSAFELSEQYPHLAMELSPSGRYVVVYHVQRPHARLIDLAEARVVRELSRQNYHPEQAIFPVLFFEHDSRELLVCASDWNRLDLYDPNTGYCLSERDLQQDNDDDTSRSIDYFRAGLYRSSDSRWIADTGWCWHPIGVVHTWSLHDWVSSNVFESDDGESMQSIDALVTDDWDKPACFLNGSYFASWGIWHDHSAHLPGVTIVDVATGKVVCIIGLDYQDCTELCWTGSHLCVIAPDRLDVLDVSIGRVIHRLSSPHQLTHLEDIVFVCHDPSAPHTLQLLLPDHAS